MATYKIVSHGGNGLPLNVETTSTISGRTNVNIWKDTGSNDQKWSINSLGTSFSGTLSYSLIDHFGLDDNDVEKIYGWTQQFCAWYVLQHYKNCKGAYKPFISYMDFDVSFSGSL